MVPPMPFFRSSGFDGSRFAFFVYHHTISSRWLLDEHVSFFDNREQGSTLAPEAPEWLHEAAHGCAPSLNPSTVFSDHELGEASSGNARARSS